MHREGISPSLAEEKHDHEEHWLLGLPVVLSSFCTLGPVVRRLAPLHPADGDATSESAAAGTPHTYVYAASRVDIRASGARSFRFSDARCLSISCITSAHCPTPALSSWIFQT